MHSLSVRPSTFFLVPTVSTSVCSLIQRLCLAFFRCFIIFSWAICFTFFHRNVMIVLTSLDHDKLQSFWYSPTFRSFVLELAVASNSLSGAFVPLLVRTQAMFHIPSSSWSISIFRNLLPWFSFSPGRSSLFPVYRHSLFISRIQFVISFTPPTIPSGHRFSSSLLVLIHLLAPISCTTLGHRLLSSYCSFCISHPFMYPSPPGHSSPIHSSVHIH